MDKSELVFLQDCQKELASLKERIAALEARISAIQEKAADEPAPVDEVDFTGVEIGVASIAPSAAEDTSLVAEEKADAPAEVSPAPEEPAPALEPEPEPMPEPEFEPEPAAAPEPELIPEPEPEPAPAPEPAPVPTPAPEAKPAPADTSNMPWRRDRPGLPVKNIRSGISLLDRAQFIGTLFKEDFALYDNTIAELNNMSTLDEAVAYIQEHFPQWNLGSEVAYRFMMAIRKKLG